MEETGLDIRISNQFFNKIKVAEFSTTFFATFGVGLSVLLYEMKEKDTLDSIRQ